MKWKSVLALLAVLVTGATYAQGPIVPANWRAFRLAPQPTAMDSNVTAALSEKQPTNVQLAANQSSAVPAQFAGHHHRAAGCATCESAPAPVSTGCSSCGAGPGFVGDCCSDYTPRRAMGLWDNFCSSCSSWGGCGHFGHHGCGCGPRLGGCCNKVPIGLYGVTPYGTCLAGVGFGNCGCGGCGHKHGCGAGGCRSFGWRWGVGGYGCDGSVGCTDCSTCSGSVGSSYAPAQSNEAPYAPADIAPSEPTPASVLPMNQVPAESLPMGGPQPAPVAPVAPMVPSLNKSAKILPRLFPAAY